LVTGCAASLPSLHPWNVTPKEAAEIQARLRQRVSRHDDFGQLRSVAGADVALDSSRGLAFAGVIVYSFPDLQEVERGYASAPITFPYVPGLLAFRELPVLLEVFAALRRQPDFILCDAQGLAHPRRFGLACHLGLWLDKPTIGCAKSRLVGEYDPPGRNVGDYSPLTDNGEVVGVVLRTRENVKPIFVSPGHKVSLQTAVRLVLACLDGYRLPKPTRQADHFVNEGKRQRAKDKGHRAAGLGP